MKRTMVVVLAGMLAMTSTLATATDKGVRRHYGGDWLAKHRLQADRHASDEACGTVPANVPANR